MVKRVESKKLKSGEFVLGLPRNSKGSKLKSGSWVLRVENLESKVSES